MSNTSIVKPTETIQLNVEQLQLMVSLVMIQNFNNHGFFIDIGKTVNEFILPSNKLMSKIFVTGIPKGSFHNF